MLTSFSHVEVADNTKEDAMFCPRCSKPADEENSSDPPVRNFEGGVCYSCMVEWQIYPLEARETDEPDEAELLDYFEDARREW